MPDFNVKDNFPMAAVIQAAQQNAQRQQQAQEYAQQQLQAGLQSIGQVGQSLYERRAQVAKSLALGRHFNYPDDISKNMTPEEVLKAAAVDKGMLDSDWLSSAFKHLAGGVPGSTQNAGSSATPVSAPGTSTNTPGGPMLTSNTTVTPIVPSSNPQEPLTPGTSSPMPVPIQAPPSSPKLVNSATANFGLKMLAMNRPENVYTNDNGNLTLTGQVPKGSKVLPSQGTADKKEQDAYFRDAVRGLQSIRGDQQVKDIETQRNAAISAYNRLRDIEYTGKAPNPVDYVDILGQVYKARTGQAPGEEILKTARQATSVAGLGRLWTLASGQQMPGTSKDIAASLKDMVAHMGLQADDLHDGVMQAHGSMIFNPNMNEGNVTKLSKISRGKSFTEATGVKPEDYDPHMQAIKWAQANPNDPRSQPILQKALQEKANKQGGSIGL